MRTAAGCLNEIPLALLDILRAQNGARLYVVGGFVRDALLGRANHDLDLAVDGDVVRVGNDVARRVRGAAVTLDSVRGTIRVVPRGPFGMIASVDFTRLRASTIEADLAGRDFTINAIAIPVREHEPRFLDPTGGLGDLQNRLVRAASPAAFEQDAVRTLRAVRFMLQLGFALDEESAGLIRQEASRLAGVAAERRRDEFVQILMCEDSARGVRLLDELGLLPGLLPDLEMARGVEQPRDHYYDVYNHCLETLAHFDLLLRRSPGEGAGAMLWHALWDRLDGVEGLREHLDSPLAEGRPRWAALKLAGLLHDVSKPETKSADPETGRIRFFGHAEIGGKRAETIVRNLRFSTREVQYIALLIHAHLRPGMLAAPGQVPTRRALYRFARDLGDAGVDLLLLNLADHAAARGPRLTLDEWIAHVDYAAWILRMLYEDEHISRPPKLVGGDDLMQSLGLKPGPRIGRLIERIREAQAAGEVTSRDEAIALARTAIAEDAAGRVGE